LVSGSPSAGILGKLYSLQNIPTYNDIDIVGLAFGAIANFKKTPFFENLIRNKLVTRNMFSFHLTRATSAGAELVLSGTNAEHYSGAIEYTPVTSATYVSILFI